MGRPGPGRRYGERVEKGVENGGEQAKRNRVTFIGRVRQQKEEAVIPVRRSGRWLSNNIKYLWVS